MNIIVCAKYALDVAEMKIDSATKTPVISGTPRKINDIDKCALEEAVKLKEKQGGKIVTVTFGPAEAKAGIKEALAIGADEAYIVEDPTNGQLDTLATSTILAAAISKIGIFDLILCGEATVDGFSSQIGPRIAEKLNIPQLTYARKITLNEQEITVERDLEESVETVKAKIPALVTVTREINTPRLPPLAAILKASKKKIEIWKPSDLGFPTDKSLQDISSTKILSVQALDSKRKAVIIRDKPADDAAAELVAYLIKEKCIGG